MRFATRLRSAAEHLTGWYIRKYPPLGLDKFHDMAMLLSLIHISEPTRPY